jgi:hypothetical protein
VSRFVPPLLVAAVVVAAPPVRAGVYTPDEPTPFKVRPDGVAEPLAFGPQFEGPFALYFATLTNSADERTAAQRGSKNDDRTKLLLRIEELKRGADRSPPGLATLAAAYLRANQPAEALNLLAPRSRDRIPDFRVLANLAHTYATRAEWNEADRTHQAAILDAEFPDDLPGTTPDQRAWLRKVEREYYRKWLVIHRQRAADRTPPEKEDVFPLFPVRFVNDAGAYEPGKLAAAEKAKLPPDAIAVVQQLLLWAPWDTALYWLLAELYAADGQLGAADTIFFQCANSRQYSNRAVLMDHRRAVQVVKAKEDAERKPAELVLPSADPTPADKPDGSRFLPDRSQVMVIGGAFGLIALALAALQVRAVVRRYRGQSRPRG